MNYKLKIDNNEQIGVFRTAFERLTPLLVNEKKNLIIALTAVLISSATTLYAPILISDIIDKYIQNGNLKGVLMFSAILLLMYLFNLFSTYTQMATMGGVGRRMLFNLRNALFNKLQELPVAFFDQNKTGDLISRINNDTDKLNQFFSQALMQFVNNIMIIIGAGIFLLVLNIRLGFSALIPALGVLILTQLLSNWVRKANLKSLQALGTMSAEIQESFNNFKVIVAFNRLDYFRNKFKQVNDDNYKASISSGIASNIFLPIYTLAGNIAQLIILSFGIYLITQGNLTVGLLIAFLLYVNNFYNPLRQMAAVWSSLQLALAGIDRISEILELESDMPIIISESFDKKSILEFRNVSFSYPNGSEVLHNINFSLERGKTYAIVGPTGGGKTTTASLMARLYDPTKGIVLLDGLDIRSYKHSERTQKIGFILQEPFLFAGTIMDNIICGNEKYINYSKKQLIEALKELNLFNLLDHFEKGIDTKILSSGDTMSLGQKQLIAFIRAILRNPEVLILDEATANVDTLTEQLLEEILRKLPKSTTKIIIAHRLNTIENADQIFFVNAGDITLAGSMKEAVGMLMHGKRES
ncbi:MAG TPA: ABC transporter ATP-binding protein [Candidatus Pacearchaeota archaeon]|nr:ABC transporter ATP-binding protein [Candidatus Pacearchaeota archaeon]HPR80116.1 ABC transporter ATP-binding protein [Candidatus Pacearchaeota archaeon]